MNERRHITVEGIVQGVGFRPFVYGLARENGLGGFVLNDSAGVTIELEGERRALDNFVQSLQKQAPPLAMIEKIACDIVPPRGECRFEIVASHAESDRRALISPDTPTCEDCLRELFDPSDRRYRYPFINCTNCGPRFTIAKDVPYDRGQTTMAGFEMCAACAREYHDAADRRFHAQPNACSKCGPQVRLLNVRGEEIMESEPISHAAYLLRHGGIVAVKGLGGYHLACNAFDEHAVRRLRSKKRREDKPFALMAPDMKAIKGVCFVSDEEECLLRSVRRPIVLLPSYGASPIAGEVAPGHRTLGWMLPYTPLHHLLLADTGLALVMTSANLSDEPIAYKDTDAFHRLGGIADYFLVHDRDIHMRCDDSVVRIIGRQELTLRRSRSYAPQPIRSAASFVEPLLACGAHLKNTFCLAKDRHVFMSHHIGDLENYETLTSFEQGIEHFKKLFDIVPAVIAHDLHPDYLSTQYALKLDGVKTIGVQHHHAHIASCMAEHDLSAPVIGVALDGTGYGTDGTIWGGEFLRADLAGFKRRAYFRKVALPGGVAAIRQPWRMGLSYLLDALCQDPHGLKLPGWQEIPAKQMELVASMIARGVNSVQTSSCGRLFDAVASILALRHEVNYEGQAAVELESVAAEGIADSYPFAIGDTLPWSIDMRPMIKQIVRELQMKVTARQIAAKFHNTLVAVILDVCERVREFDGLSSVCLGGGVFQNAYLLERVVPALRASGFSVYRNLKVPLNDGGVCLGQAVIANEIIRRGG